MYEKYEGCKKWVWITLGSDNSHGIKKVHDEVNEFRFADLAILIVVDDINKRLDVLFLVGHVFSHFRNHFLDELVDLFWREESILVDVDLCKQSLHDLWYCLVESLLFSLLVAKLIGQIADIIMSLFASNSLLSTNGLIRHNRSCHAIHLSSNTARLLSNILCISKHVNTITLHYRQVRTSCHPSSHCTWSWTQVSAPFRAFQSTSPRTQWCW